MFKPVTLPSDSTSTSFPSTTFNRPHSLSPPSLAYPHRRPSSVTCRSAVQDRPQTTTNSKSLYDVLRVDRNASRMEIKTAYRSLAKVYHPDTRTLPADDMSDGQYFIEIRNAYETLSDPAARAAYDLRLGGGGSRRGERLAYSMDDLASLRYDGSRRPGYCPTRRWESDQCW